MNEGSNDALLLNCHGLVDLIRDLERRQQRCCQSYARTFNVPIRANFFHFWPGRDPCSKSSINLPANVMFGECLWSEGALEGAKAGRWI